jgi:hypothetical protein
MKTCFYPTKLLKSKRLTWPIWANPTKWVYQKNPASLTNTGSRTKNRSTRLKQVSHTKMGYFDQKGLTPAQIYLSGLLGLPDEAG